MLNVQQCSCTHCRSDSSVRLMRWVTVIKLREATYTMLVDVIIESLNEIFCSTVECFTHHSEAEVDIRCEEFRECTTLVVSEVTVDL